MRKWTIYLSYDLFSFVFILMKWSILGDILWKFIVVVSTSTLFFLTIFFSNTQKWHSKTQYFVYVRRKCFCCCIQIKSVLISDIMCVASCFQFLLLFSYLCRDNYLCTFLTACKT